MGKCISKNPTSLTIALSEKDLATASHILSKFTESSEYVALKDEHRNQLCEYYAVKNTPNGGDIVVITKTNCSTNSNASQKTKIPQQHEEQEEHEEQEQLLQQRWHQHQEENCKDDFNQENTCLHSLDHWTVTKNIQKQQIVNNDDKSNDAVDNVQHGYTKTSNSNSNNKLNNDCGDVIESMLVFNEHLDDNYDSGYNNNNHNNNNQNNNNNADEDEDKYITIIKCSSSCNNDNNNNKNSSNNNKNTTNENSQERENIIYADINLANCNNRRNKIDINKNNANNNNNDDDTNYYASEMPPYLSQHEQHQKQTELETEEQHLQPTPSPTHKTISLIDYYLNKKKHRLKKAKVKKKEKKISSTDDDVEEMLEFDVEGQAESKKHSKKHNACEIQTKGTAMSFGFRKNLNTTPKKLKKLIKGENSKHSKKQDKYNANDSDKTDKGNAVSGGGVGGESCGEVVAGLNTGDGNNKTDTVIDTNNKICTDRLVNRDDNGNADLLNNVHFEKMGAAAAATVQTNQNPTVVGGSGGVSNVKLPGAGNRFGFRGTYRPSSTDITSRQQRESHDNIENNNYANNGNNTKGVLVSNLKRRSKSAHAGRTTSSSNESDTETGTAPRNTQTKTITFNLKQNSTIEYDRRQFFEQPTHATSNTTTSGNMNIRGSHNMATGLYNHNNVIVRPTPRVAATTMAATAYSKFTLQTVSLPKPEFAVAISINATTPTTPANNSYVSSAAAVGVGTRTRDHSSTGRHPLTVAQTSSSSSIQATTQRMDAKQAKHMTNSTRRTFSGSREISADSGIASMDMALDSSTSSNAGSVKRTASPKRSRSRPRNLQMVMNGRHRFEVKDLDDSLSSESSSIVEPLALPKLPTENQTVPLPLSGLIRSNTVLSRESYELRNSVAKHKENNTEIAVETKPQHPVITNLISRQPSEEDSESVDEEKLHLDRSATEKGLKERQFKDINTCSSKTSSPGSSVISSWCNAGESLAANDFSNLSISSSEDSNKQDNKLEDTNKEIDNKLSFDLNDEDLVTLNTDVPISTISSITEPVALNKTDETDNVAKIDTNLSTFDNDVDKFERPKTLCSSLNESKFAEMALEGSTFLLDDETSPTDSLVSSTESEEAACKQKKHKMNEELQEKDIDEISPELDLGSPISPGTPTHASHSLSLSDCGNLIDDEIADQPALLFNQDSQDGGGGGESVTSRRDKTDTPTLMESMGSMRASINKSRSALHQAMELSLRTPLSLRKAVMERAESLDTLSPCESICSDDLMMDFDVASSMDSIDRSASIKSRSGSDLNNIDDNELFSEFDRKGNDVMKELNSILRSRSQKNNEKDITAHLPARATRLLNRSRMQQHCTLNNDNDSDSTKSPLAGRRRTSSRASTASSSTNNQQNNSNSNNSANSSLHRKFPHNHHHHHHPTSSSYHQRDTHSSSDDLMLYDKSFRNAMIQDVLQFKKQLLRLRKILQENENCLTRTETLNPFENDNGQLFTSCGLDSKLLDDIDLASLTSSTTDDPIQELADLRRQGQVDDRDRTIRLQKNLIEKLEAEKLKTPHAANEIATKECVDSATQTERTRPLTIGTESLSSKPEYTSYTTYFPAICSDSTTIIQHHQQNPGCVANNQTRRHTIISTTLTNYNQQLSNLRHTPRRASIAWEKQTPSYKPVKITLIGDPLKHWQSEGNSLNKTKDDEFSKNFINTNLSKQQQQQQENQQLSTKTTQQENAHNNIILNSKHHHRLQDIMLANEIKTQNQHNLHSSNNNNNNNNNNQHHHHRNHNHHNQSNQQLQQQQQSHQFYKTTSHHNHHHHQHNNLKPTVTIV